jgi:hypothetical protein
MLAPAELTELAKHPYWLSYVALTTYLAFIRKKGPVVKKSLEKGINGLADLNRVLCKAIRRCHTDWCDMRRQLARERQRPMPTDLIPRRDIGS